VPLYGKLINRSGRVRKFGQIAHNFKLIILRSGERSISATKLTEDRQFGYKRDIFKQTMNCMCLYATSSGAAFVGHWLNQGCQVFCSLQEHCSTSVSQYTGKVLYVKLLPVYKSQNRNIETYKQEHNGNISSETQNNKHSLKYVAYSLKERLPT
jgi:hypothetical protein